ncbi:MAG: hypothetical protein OCD76_15360 [Reichenbachiella sp.]
MTSKKFVSGILVTIVVYISVNKFLIYDILGDPDNLHLKTNTKDVVIGPSQGRLAINPDTFDYMENLCVLGEFLLFTEKKLKLILSRNNNIKRVLLPVSIVTFSYNREEHQFNKETLIGKNVTYEYLLKDDSIGEFSEVDLFVTKRRNKYKFGITPPNREEWFAMLQYYFKGEPLTKAHPNWGGYSPVFSSNLQTEHLIEKIFYKDEKVSDFSFLQAKYFDRIIDICVKNNVELILVGMPTVQAFYNGVPDIHKFFFDSLIDNRLVQNPSLKYLDFTRAHYPDSLYSDAFHLNYDGSVFFGEILRDSID